MKKVVITIFDDENLVQQAQDALSDLTENGSITVFGTVVLTRDDAGVLSVKRPADNGPLGSVVGMVSGALVGLLAGPFGAFAGASVGGLVGAVRDLRQAGMDVEFVDAVARDLSPGKVAVVAEMQEELTAPLDERMSALGGVVIRRTRSEILEDVLAHEVEDERLEISELEAELDMADEQLSEEVRREIAAAKEKLEKTAAAIEARLSATREEMETRIQYLEAQMEGASDRKKVLIQRRVTELRNDFEARAARLQKAGALVAEAIR